ncbi:MAG: hypothetical protein J1F28_02555 [Oscillospiraceae bacterium]|nr:hypothetical protein [Oscillospiraceae bacterium]
MPRNEKENMVLRKILLAVIAMLALLMCGCSDTTELGNRAIIEAIAIDFDNFDEEYKVSALLFSSSGEKLDPSQENAIKVSGNGKTLSEAIDNISLSDGKRLYMSETKLLVLGGGFEQENVLPALNALYYDLRCSLNMPVCCAQSAELLTDIQFIEGMTSAEKPLSMLENAENLGVSPNTTLLDLLADNAAGRPSLIPFFVPDKNGRGMTESGDTISLSGTRRLKSGKLSGTYDQNQTISLMISENKAKTLSLNFSLGSSEKTCLAYDIRSELDPNGMVCKVSAKFKSKNGGPLSKEEEIAALNELAKIASKTK